MSPALFPSERVLARLVLGEERADRWPEIAPVLEKRGLPGIDPLMGARYWPHVVDFFERDQGRAKDLVDRRVNAVPYRPDGVETFHAAKPKAADRRRRLGADRDRRTRTTDY